MLHEEAVCSGAWRGVIDQQSLMTEVERNEES